MGLFLIRVHLLLGLGKREWPFLFPFDFGFVWLGKRYRYSDLFSKVFLWLVFPLFDCIAIISSHDSEPSYLILLFNPSYDIWALTFDLPLWSETFDLCELLYFGYEVDALRGIGILLVIVWTLMVWYWHNLIAHLCDLNLWNLWKLWKTFQDYFIRRWNFFS